jgi:hypothetical protein
MATEQDCESSNWLAGEGGAFILPPSSQEPGVRPPGSPLPAQSVWVPAAMGLLAKGRALLCVLFGASRRPKSAPLIAVHVP